MDFRVRDASGARRLRGTVREEFLTDFPKAAANLQNHLANHLRGHMPKWNINKISTSR
jgi:hypothetical protein